MRNTATVPAAWIGRRAIRPSTGRHPAPCMRIAAMTPDRPVTAVSPLRTERTSALRFGRPGVRANAACGARTSPAKSCGSRSVGRFTGQTSTCSQTVENADAPSNQQGNLLSSAAMRIVSWNVNHRTTRKRIPVQMGDVIGSLRPDLVVLTEFVPGPSSTYFVRLMNSRMNSGVITFEGIVQFARVRYAASRCWITPRRRG